MIRWFIRWLFPYDANGAITAPTGEKKVKKKSKSKKSKETLYIDSEGNTFKKEQVENVDIAWGQTNERKGGKVIPAMSEYEKELVIENDLNVAKYEELRGYWFNNLTPYSLEKKYKKENISGFGKSTTYPYYTLWKKIHVQNIQK